MKYKILVLGNNKPVIDDFFIHMDDVFEAVSCSVRYTDIMRHIKYFVPDALVYCAHNEHLDSIKQMVNIKPVIQKSRTPIILIGTAEECNEFQKTAVNVVNLEIVKPFTAHSITEKIVKFMDERQEYVETYREKQAAEENISPINESYKPFGGGGHSKVDDLDLDSLRNALSSLDAALNDSGSSDVTGNALFEKSRSAGNPDMSRKPAANTEERKHILVVDDDPIMLKTVKEQLHNDYDIATAINGKIAMKFLERKKTDLILLDYEMPGENGPDVLEKIRQNQFTKDIPVVFLTGVSDREKIQEAIALKPQGYLLKPIDHDKLIDTINHNIK